MPMKLDVQLRLPDGFRKEDILAFHRRDSREVAERVGESCFEKGLIWQGAPACLLIRFEPGRVDATLAGYGEPAADGQVAFDAMVRRMLGLTQDVEAFEAQHCRHPQFGVILERQAGLRVPAAATPFEALTWAITGQQIRVHAAVALRRRLIEAVGMRYAGENAGGCLDGDAEGLLCYPAAEQISRLTEASLRAAGFSQSKARTLLALAGRVMDGSLPLDAWAQRFPDAEWVRQQLLAVRGIGPWTVNYALLRGFGWLDGSLHGDVAVRRSLQSLLASPEKITEAATQAWLAQFSPWRALVAAHLWAAQSTLAM
jgi:DNA-3-methyladenine glycosylase II